MLSLWANWLVTKFGLNSLSKRYLWPKLSKFIFCKFFIWIAVCKNKVLLFHIHFLKYRSTILACIEQTVSDKEIIQSIIEYKQP